MPDDAPVISATCPSSDHPARWEVCWSGRYSIIG